MKYIKVTNETSQVNRLKLEKLGFSTKRDNEETIGQFGSGIKFAPISAIRKGMEFIFAGEDTKGLYTLEYIVKDDEGVPSVFYKYQDYEKPSSFTVDAGLLSWENDFQIYREVVANAMDESKLTGLDWNIEVVDVDKIEAVSGEFSVYITATDSMIELNDNFDKYFSVNRSPIYVGNKFKLYEPIDDLFRVYCKGVLVYTSKSKDKFELTNEIDDVSGFFDYEFDELELNEERTIKYESEMNGYIAKVFARIDDDSIIEHIIKCFEYAADEGYEKYHETSRISVYGYTGIQYLDSGNFSRVFKEKYPKTIVIHEEALTINLKATLRAQGYEHFTLHSDAVVALMNSLSLPSYQSIFGEYFVHDITMDIDGYPVLKEAIKIVNEVLPETKKVNEFIGVYFDDKDSDTMAVTTKIKINADDEVQKRILFNNYYAENSNIKTMISTIVHEWDHYRSDIGDGNNEGRMFRDLADQTISELIYQLWKTKSQAGAK